MLQKIESMKLQAKEMLGKYEGENQTMEETIRNLAVSYEHYLYLRKIFGLEEEDERGDCASEQDYRRAV